MMRSLYRLAFAALLIASPAWCADKPDAGDKKEEKKPPETSGHQGGKAGKAGRTTKDRSE